MLDRAPHVRGLEELLGGDASAVQAGASHLVALDQGDAQAGGRGVEGGGVSAGSAPNDNYIKLLDLIRHGLTLHSLIRRKPMEF